MALAKKLCLGGRKIGKPVRLEDGNAIKIGTASMIFRVFQRTGSTASTVGDRKGA